MSTCRREVEVGTEEMTAAVLAELASLIGILELHGEVASGSG